MLVAGDKKNNLSVIAVKGSSNLSETSPRQAGRSQKYDPRAAAISKFGLDNLAPCSRLCLAVPFPSRAAIFFRPGDVYLYFTLFTRPVHLSEQPYLDAPAWGTATRDLLRCCCGTSVGFAPSRPRLHEIQTNPVRPKTPQDSCLIQDYYRRSSASRRAVPREYHWTFAVAKT